MDTPFASTAAQPGGPVRSAIHLSASPEETYLLTLQLEEDGLAVSLSTVSDGEALRAAMGSTASFIVADLPLPWDGAAEELDEIQRTRPDVPVVFRWGGAGRWSAEDGSAQVARSVRSVLSLGFDRPQSPEEHRRILQEVVRYQQAHLRLGELHTDDWEAALRAGLEIMADTARVERVSVWRIDARASELECEALFTRSQRAHSTGGRLALSQPYLDAAQRATFVAAPDAVQDPRTSEFGVDYLHPLRIVSMLDAPIRAGGQVVGMMCLESVDAPRQWNVVEQCAAAAFAGFVGRLLEIRERKRLQTELEASRRMELVGRLASAVAHDFGNFATVIVGGAGTLLAELPHDDPQRPMLEAVHRAGISSGDLVRQLLAFAKAPVSPARTVDLCQVLRETAPLMRRLLGASVTLAVTAPDDAVWIRLDTAQAQRVLLNLAANARDAMTGGGRFTVDLRREDAAGGRDTFDAVLRLRDTGRGMSASVLPHIFTPLFTTKSASGGTGLGLSAVKTIVDDASGAIAVGSEVDRGTWFELRFPVAAAPADAALPARARLGPLGSRTVLVVDDNRAVAQLIGHVLQRQGCLVRVVDVAAAVDVAAMTADHLDLIVSDVNLREVSGWDLVARLRQDRPALPALMISGQPEALSRAGLDARRTRVLPKPFDPQVLVDEVRALLDTADTGRR
ncbi:MAG: response regulator [Vicinamibacterales bacterium]